MLFSHFTGLSTTSIKHFEFLGKMLWSSLEKMLAPWKKTVTNLDSILKSRDITLPTKTHQVKAMVFSSSHVWMGELDHKNS